MKFSQWLENALEDEQKASIAPSSAEVLRTGLQPQVDAQEINTRQKEEHDKLLAIDSHVERVKSTAEQMDTRGSRKLKLVKMFISKFADEWNALKEDPPAETGAREMGFKFPSDGELDYLKKNQPLPRDQVQPGPGTYGNS